MAEVSDAQSDFFTRLLSQYRGRTLRRGDKSKSTRAIQLFLRSKGYDIKADGVFGPRTEAAVREWQKKEGLSADGQVGKRSLTKIREGITPTPKARPTAIPRGDFASPVGFEKETALPPLPSPDAGATPSTFRGGPRGDPLPHHTPITMPDGTVLGGSPSVVSAPSPPSFEPTISPSARMPSMPSTTALPAPPEPPPAPLMGPMPPMPSATAPAPVAPLPAIAEASPTVPSDLNPEQLGRVREMQGIGPFPPRPGEPGAMPAAPDMAGALAGGGPPIDPNGAFPAAETASQVSGLPPLNQDSGAFPETPGYAMPSGTGVMSPQTLALIKALMARQQQQSVPGV